MVVALILAQEIPLTWHISKDPEALHRPIIVFVHNYGGNSHTTKRHSQMLLDLGYSSVSFTLSLNGTPMGVTWPWNMIINWSKEINQVINQLDKNRKKVIFGFSGPSAPALGTIGQRLQQSEKDIVGYICDSGPFTDAWDCTRKMVKYFLKVKNPIIREARLMLMMMVWGFNHNKKLRQIVDSVAQIRADFPILSVRGILDKIVPIEKIDEVFRDSKLTNVEVKEFESDHLAPLKDHPEEYTKAIKNFLERLNTGNDKARNF